MQTVTTLLALAAAAILVAFLVSGSDAQFQPVRFPNRPGLSRNDGWLQRGDDDDDDDLNDTRGTILPPGINGTRGHGHRGGFNDTRDFLDEVNDTRVIFPPGVGGINVTRGWGHILHGGGFNGTRDFPADNSTRCLPTGVAAGLRVNGTRALLHGHRGGGDAAANGTRGFPAGIRRCPPGLVPVSVGGNDTSAVDDVLLTTSNATRRSVSV